MGGSLAGAGGALERTMAALEQMTARGGARFGLMVAAAVVLLFFATRYAVKLANAP